VSLRSRLRRVPPLRAAYHKALIAKTYAEQSLAHSVTFERLPAPLAVSMAYEVMLGYKPTPDSIRGLVDDVQRGTFSRQDVVHMIRGSEDFNTLPRYSAGLLGYSIHAGRSQFVRMLPRARRILDLGGTHQHRDVGAMVGLGYPYPFDELVIVDLPSDDRHEIYKTSDRLTEVESHLGLVSYRYHSMTDLSPYDDDRFGLVYSGQSIEHVTRDEGASVLSQIHRVLAPGGYLAMDTPNATVTRLQQSEFIDPDHKVEYEIDELRGMISKAGFVDVLALGLNYAGPSLEAGKFDQEQVARSPGLYADAGACYILCVICRKPG
jgi:predicted SAM-dependent methyltransferase